MVLVTPFVNPSKTLWICTKWKAHHHEWIFSLIGLAGRTCRVMRKIDRSHSAQVKVHTCCVQIQTNITWLVILQGRNTLIARPLTLQMGHRSSVPDIPHPTQQHMCPHGVNTVPTPLSKPASRRTHKVGCRAQRNGPRVHLVLPTERPWIHRPPLLSATLP
jgi:hypothetical protein